MTLYEKVYGCLLAGAIGNVMGHPVENQHFKEIKEKHGKITSLIEPGAIDTEDDIKFVLWLCKTYIKKGGRITPEDWAKTWLEEMDPIEMLWVRNVYELLYRGYSPRITGSMNINHGAAIMCVAPIGIYNAGEPDNAYIDALDLGYMQQPEQDTTCSAVMAACFAKAMEADAMVDDVIETALSKAPKVPYHAFDTRGRPNNIYDAIKKGIDISKKYTGESLYEELYKNCLMWEAWDPMEVLTLTLAVFNASKGDIRETIILGANIGRDADTIANLAGGLTGAINGYKKIPEEWIKQISSGSLTRLIEISKDMHGLLINKFKKSIEQVRLFEGL